MIDQFERAKEQQEQDRQAQEHGKAPEQEHDQNREKDRGTDNR